MLRHIIFVAMATAIFCLVVDAEAFAKSHARDSGGSQATDGSDHNSGAHAAKPEPKPESKPDPKPEAKPESKPERKPDTQHEARPERKPDPKPEAKPESKPERKPDAQPETKPDPEPASKDEVKPENERESKPERKPESKPEAKPNPKPEHNRQSSHESKPESKPETKPDPEPASKDEVKPETERESKPSPNPEAEPEHKPREAKPESKPQSKPERTPDYKPDPNSSAPQSSESDRHSPDGGSDQARERDPNSNDEHADVERRTERPRNDGSIHNDDPPARPAHDEYSRGTDSRRRTGGRDEDVRTPAENTRRHTERMYGIRRWGAHDPAGRHPGADHGFEGRAHSHCGWHAVPKLPRECEIALWHGDTYYHYCHHFYRPCWYGGVIYYRLVVVPIGWFFIDLPDGATEFTVNYNAYYYCDGAYYREATENGRVGYVAVEAPQAAQAESEQDNLPDPLGLLRNMSDYLSEQRHFTLTLSDTYDEIDESGGKTQVSGVRTIHVQRPDRMAVDSISDDNHQRIVYDGESFTTIDLPRNLYGTVPMRGTIDEVLDKLATDYGMTLPMEDILYKDIYERLSARITGGQYLGEETVAGVKCDHVAFTQDDADWEIWIQQGDTPIPRMIVINYKDMAGEPRYMMMVTKWDTAPIPESAFELKLPEGATKIDLMPVDKEEMTGEENLPNTPDDSQ